MYCHTPKDGTLITLYSLGMHPIKLCFEKFNGELRIRIDATRDVRIHRRVEKFPNPKLRVIDNRKRVAGPFRPKVEALS